MDFFPGYSVKKGENTIQNITLENMLTMTAPYKYKFAPYIKYFTSEDWVGFTLDLLGGKGRIGKFRYAPLIGPDILSGILAKAVGRSVLDFASENLFAPLGITVEKILFFRARKNRWHSTIPQISAAGSLMDPALTQADGALPFHPLIWLK